MGLIRLQTVRSIKEDNKCSTFLPLAGSRPPNRACALQPANLEMSSKKRKNDLPENVSSNQSAEIDGDDESDWKHQLAAMRAQLDASRAELVASQAENARLRAAVLAPCLRCNFHLNWAVRVRTMAGRVHSIACPDGPTTLIAHVKQELAQVDPKFHLQQQLVLVLPCEASSSSSSSIDADSIDPQLADDRTMASAGVSNGDLLELLVVDIDWDQASLDVIERIKHGGDKVRLFRIDIRDDDLALSWALLNEVFSIPQQLHRFQMALKHSCLLAYF